MSYLDSLVEQQIAAAMARGEFDDLPGRGRPIADLDTQRQPGWFAEQLVRRERSRVRHDETMAELADRRVALWRAPTLADLRERVVATNRFLAEANALLEPSDRIELLDFRAVADTWRTTHPSR